jgi:type IV secretory pathway VirD2 relaxase
MLSTRSANLVSGMSSDDDFEPRLGRMRAKGNKKARKYLSRVLAAANLARGGTAGSSRRSRFDGSRIGRGSGVGRVLGSRDRYAAFRARRVIIKSRIVKLAGKGFAERRRTCVMSSGTARPARVGAASFTAPMATSHRRQGMARAQAQGDRHQFRFIVSPEDGAEYDDLKHLTRRLMARMEEDLGTKLDWVAVDHFNTGHPHTHLLVRGKDDRGKDLIIAREYITQGMRERAAELVDLDLGPRTTDAIQDRLRGEVDQERLTSIDRTLLRDADAARLVSSSAGDAFDQTVRMGRLRKLERLGLAEQMGASTWRLAPDLADTLKRMGERGDIIRTMQRAFAARGADARRSPIRPSMSRLRRMPGRWSGACSNAACRMNSMIVTICWSRRPTAGPIMSRSARARISSRTRRGAIVRVEPVAIGVRDADRTVAAVAAGQWRALYDRRASPPRPVRDRRLSPKPMSGAWKRCGG